MCPFDVTMGWACSYFELFLPTFNVWDKKDDTYQLWFDELMSFWDASHNAPPWELVTSIGDFSKFSMV